MTPCEDAPYTFWDLLEEKKKESKKHFPGYLDSYFKLRWSKGGSGGVSDNQPSESFHVSIS